MEPTLPMPPQESPPVGVSPNQDSGYQIEQVAAQPERLSEPPLAVPPPVAAAPPAASAAPIQSAVQSQAASSATDDGNPQIADDVDVIEKEWVDKAKKIVDSTKSDPYEQEKQVSKLQADYMLKRYNKQIKTVE